MNPVQKIRSSLSTIIFQDAGMSTLRVGEVKTAMGEERKIQGERKTRLEPRVRAIGRPRTTSGVELRGADGRSETPQGRRKRRVQQYPLARSLSRTWTQQCCNNTGRNHGAFYPMLEKHSGVSLFFHVKHRIFSFSCFRGPPPTLLIGLSPTFSSSVDSISRENASRCSASFSCDCS